MKFFRIFLICCCIIVLVAFSVSCSRQTDCLRIHVRANSDSLNDQKIKYQIKDELVEFLTPIIKDCNTKAQAISAVKKNESAINQLIDSLLVKNGFDYSSKIQIRKEQFPTRVYDGKTFPEGVYEAIIVELGKAEGANWWCVVYPPLCFSGGKVRYKSIFSDLF